MSRDSDFVVTNEGSTWLFLPMSGAAQDRAQEIGLESWQWRGGGFAVEARMAADLADGLRGEGFVLEGE